MKRHSNSGYLTRYDTLHERCFTFQADLFLKEWSQFMLDVLKALNCMHTISNGAR
jgi:hypothetical protein